MGLIFRNDDVNMNSDFIEMDEMYRMIRKSFPTSEIWSCVTIFSRGNAKGTVYPTVPFKDKPFNYFLEVDRVCDQYRAPDYVKVVSHGLWHLNHSKINPELQEASIVTSCNLLDTATFVPPFNAWNKDTDKICKKHDIELVKFEDGWKSLEHNAFDPRHKKWYFHSWNFNPEKLAKQLNVKNCK